MLMYKWILLFVLYKMSSAIGDERKLFQIDDPTLVTLPEGQIRGHVLRSPNGNEYYAFQEIPYAAPPVGKLRFQAPQAPQKWDDVLSTTKNTKICLQGGGVMSVDLSQTEDCLYLNVYTPQRPGDPSKTPRAVLVWIYGGGFTTGAAASQLYKPQYFIDHNVVVVAMNYRLGPLGFLTTEDGVIPGNLALKDQQFALQWIKKNINLFGGDPEKITISGESAGGVSVGYHLFSKKNHGLFRAAILHSGTSLMQAYQDYARFYAFELGRSLDANFTSNDSRELLTLLQSVSASDINNNTITVDIGKEIGLFEGEGAIWGPVIEDDNLEDTFYTGLFHEDLKNGNINQVPILIGFNSEEALLLMMQEPSLPEKRAKYFDSDLSNLIRNKFNMTKENKLTAGRKLRQIYTDGTFEDDLAKVVKFQTEESFSTPIVRHAKLQSNFTDVYLYQFSYKGKMGSLWDLEIAGVRGVAHTEDLCYLWDAHLIFEVTSDDPEDLRTRQRLLTLWSNFVKYLNPTPEKDSLLNNVTWEKVTPNNLVYLNVNTTLEMEVNVKHYLEWEKIIDVYAIPPLITY